MKKQTARIVYWTAALCALPLAISSADFDQDARGTTSANFLKLGVGARAEAMGGAYSAVANDATALYWNPGALTRIQARSAETTLMHAPYAASSFFDYGAFAKNETGYDAWGLGLQYFTAGKITQTDENGFEQGTFAPYDLAVSAGYAHAFDPLSIGFSAKLIRSHIVASAQTAAVDIGFVSSPLWDRRLRLSGVVTNIGGKLKFEQEGSRLPMAYRVGSSWELTPKWLAAADVAFPIDNSPYGLLGSEYRWAVGTTWKAAIRGGFNTRAMQDLTGLAGVSFGVGMDFETIGIDYALQPLGDLGLTHRISLTFRFLPISVTLPKKQTNLHVPDYPDYNDVQPYFDDAPSLRDVLQ